jgi:hypothetical protein
MSQPSQEVRDRHIIRIHPVAKVESSFPSRATRQGPDCYTNQPIRTWRLFGEPADMIQFRREF